MFYSDRFPIMRTLLAPFRTSRAPHVLFIANGNIPTLQLSFLEPLRPIVERKDLVCSVLIERDIKGLQKRGATASTIRRLAPDVVVFCRYSGIEAEAIANAARELGAQIVFHVDDDLLNVPRSLGEKKYQFHSAPERLAAVRYLLEHSDLVYAANARLASSLKQQAKIKRVVTGEVYCASEIMRAPAEGKARRIGYMGIDHSEDLAAIAPAIATVLDLHPSLEFQVFGPMQLPSQLERFGQRITRIEQVHGYSEFKQRLVAAEWDIGLAPLVNTPFNHVKSNTKWVEYTAAGMATVASACPTYEACCDDDCGLLVEGTDPGPWSAALGFLVADVTRRHRVALNAQKRVRSDYSPERLQKQILDVLREAGLALSATPVTVPAR